MFFTYSAHAWITPISREAITTIIHWHELYTAQYFYGYIHPKTSEQVYWEYSPWMPYLFVCVRYIVFLSFLSEIFFDEIKRSQKHIYFAWMLVPFHREQWRL